MAQSEKAVPMVEMYMSDFGNITAPGLGACLGNHLKTKSWKWVQHGDLSAPRVKEFICSRACAACKIEGTLNTFAQQVWRAGGILTAIEIEPPAPGTPPQPQSTRRKMRRRDEGRYDDY